MSDRMATTKRGFGAALAGLSMTVAAIGAAAAHDHHASRPAAAMPGADPQHEHGVETENLFGFTAGSDVGERGETEFAIDVGGAFGKRDGRYRVWTPKLEVGHTPVDNLHVALGVSLAHHDIAGVPGLDDLDRGVFDALSLEVKYRLLERGPAPFGLTLVFEPHWGRVEEGSGERVTKYAGEFKLLADAELVRDRLFAALNLLYEPEHLRLVGSGEVEKESTLGFSAALSGRLVDGVFLGGELRYLRKYEGLGLDAYAGDALFAGPNLFVALPNDWWASAAWGVQLAGRSESEPDFDLNLDQFARHEVKFKLGTHF